MSEFPDLDKIVTLRIFCGPQRENSNRQTILMCDHTGSLVKNGFNLVNGNKIQRYKCSRCGKRFGTAVIPYDLLKYQQTLKKILYELLYLGTNQRSIAIRYGIPQEMISRFKKRCIEEIYSQNRELIEIPEKNVIKRNYHWR